MLFMSPGEPPVALRGCFVSDSELAAIVMMARGAAGAAEEQMERRRPGRGCWRKDEKTGSTSKPSNLCAGKGRLRHHSCSAGCGRLSRAAPDRTAGGGRHRRAGPGGAAAPVLIETERDSGEPVDEG